MLGDSQYSIKELLFAIAVVALSLGAIRSGDDFISQGGAILLMCTIATAAYRFAEGWGVFLGALISIIAWLAFSIGTSNIPTKATPPVVPDTLFFTAIPIFVAACVMWGVMQVRGAKPVDAACIALLCGVLLVFFLLIPGVALPILVMFTGRSL
jgi:hypothetical protein